jgi:hypothetical protein
MQFVHIEFLSWLLVDTAEFRQAKTRLRKSEAAPTDRFAPIDKALCLFIRWTRSSRWRRKLLEFYPGFHFCLSLACASFSATLALTIFLTSAAGSGRNACGADER